MYEQAIDEFEHLHSMFRLAALLGDGGNGVGQDVERAVSRYEGGIEEGAQGRSMEIFARLLEDDRNGVAQDVERVVKL